MLTRFVRIQLAIFAIVGIIGIIGMVLYYIQLPTLLGIGRMINRDIEHLRLFILLRLYPDQHCELCPM